ncbi:MAG: LacI family transcriptional regulator, partial [Epulopiscium sp.]|nr:LacI family transcriptional regulator [Candidatus Epulonipiscium sp.]
MEKPTIADVAKYAGVSITTVSRVINNNYPVKEETRQKVEEAINALNFKPNYLARSLIGKSTHTIGVVVPSITNLFFPVVVKG